MAYPTAASQVLLRQRLLQSVAHPRSPNSLASLLSHSLGRGALHRSTTWGTAGAARLVQRRWQSSTEHQSRIHVETRPPPLRRVGSFLWGSLRFVLAFQLVFVLGVYLGWQTHPQKAALQSYFLRQPTDEETLAAYAPPDPESAAINAHIVEHPLARSLRARPDYVESRPHLKLPAELRQTNLTAGVLMGPRRIAVPPVQFVQADGKDYVSIFYLGPDLCGHPGIIHGGLLATLLDEGLARCCFQALPNKVGVTANLQIDYKKPVMAEGYYVLRARTTKVDGRKAFVDGWIEKLGDEGVAAAAAGGDQQRLVNASGLFIEPRNAKMMATLYRIASDPPKKP